MSEKIKAKIGEELYNQILEKGIKPEEFDLVNDGTYVPRARLNEVNGKLKATEDKITTYENQLGETKKLLEGSEEFKTKYDSLLEQHKKDIEDKDLEILNTSKQFLVESKLRDSGAKHVDLLMNKINLEDLTIDNKNLLGMDSVLEGLQKEYSDLFVEKNTTNNTTTKPGTNDNDNDPDSENWDEMLKDL